MRISDWSEVREMRRPVIIFLLGSVVGFLLISGFMAVLTHVRGH